jgi:peptidoglycan/LPS O-acetylase OafA/YrhL
VSDNFVARLLAWRPLVALGTMSYSLYLVHQPVLQVLGTLLAQRRPDLSPHIAFAILLASFPIVLLLAWILFTTVERRTLTSGGAPTIRLRFGRPQETAAALVATPEA